MRDEMLANHAKYPDIYIDDVQDPVAFYSNELKGTLGRRSIASEVSSATRRTLSGLRILAVTRCLGETNRKATHANICGVAMDCFQNTSNCISENVRSSFWTHRAAADGTNFRS